MTPERVVAATSSTREPGQRIGTARTRALQHLADARALVGALKILRSQKPDAAQDALDQLRKAIRALMEEVDR